MVEMNEVDVTEGAPQPPRKLRGFARLSKEAVQAIASKGGIAAHAQGTAYRFTHEKAVEAGRKGRQARTANERAEKYRKAALTAVRGLGG